ncbi:prephenate dehydrogenase/arogenate dehydrogenase family protein [Halovenus rubra]|uniref:Prephenate dehydrogenase/arogenate dehydrogenase family protein n=2 Tax=Halovenus rubra TaxID=869890 RepID=A0ACC7E1Y4_9EURY|nr:prephenate dehydrogenase/arogenate dehydrogenase family protein [Halovenus rubra]
MEVLVVGAGSMGRWLGQVFVADVGPSLPATARDECTVTYYDRSNAAATQAAKATGGHTVTSVTQEYDVVAIAVPISAAPTAIASHAGNATCAVVDVTGTMKKPVEALRSNASAVERCSLHPLFAPPNEPGNVPVVTDKDGPVTTFIQETLEARGNNVFETTPEEHDSAMKTVQASAHAAIMAYSLAGESVPDRFQTAVSKELSALVEQVGGNEPSVYGEIQAAFEGAEDVAAAANKLAVASESEFEQLYDKI